MKAPAEGHVSRVSCYLLVLAATALTGLGSEGGTWLAWAAGIP